MHAWPTDCAERYIAPLNNPLRTQMSLDDVINYEFLLAMWAYGSTRQTADKTLFL